MSILALGSRVHAVTVYRTGALVTRRAGLVRGPDGYPGVVRMTGLPLSLDDGSMRVRIEVDRDGELPIATGLRMALDVPGGGAALEPPVDAQIVEARRRVLELAGRRDQLVAEMEVLRALHAPRRPAPEEGHAPPPIPTETRLELVSFRHQELERRQAQMRQLVQELTAAQETLKHLEYRRDRASSARPAREHELRKSAVVELAAREARAGTAWLDVEYLVPGARWTPAYALELDGDCARGRLAVRALVCQATGEDWPGVAMRLSTADAQAWAELPELTSLRIGRRQASPGRRGWVPPPTGADELYGDYDRARTPARAAPEVLEALEVAAITPGDDVLCDAFDGVADESTMLSAELELRKDVPATREKGVSRKRSAPALSHDGVYSRIDSGPIPASAPAPEPAMRQSASFARAEARAMSAGSGAHQAGSGIKAGGRAGVARAARPRPPPPGPLRPASDLLEYGRLRLAPPDGAERGQLAMKPLSQEYVELLAELRVSVKADVSLLMTNARVAAANAGARPAPARHVWPGPVDGFDYAYRADFPLDVPSDGEYHGVTLAQRDGPVELKHVCVPRETADVFRVAGLANPLDAPLLEGPVDISVAGEFRLTSPLRTVPARGRLELGLGVEPAIKVARNTRYREETGGLMSTSLTLEHEITIEVINHLKQRAVLEVRERVPVAREGDDQATVTVGAVSPPWKDYRPVGQELRGGHVWNLLVEPGDKKELKTTYSIAIASKNELVGGNRREG